MNVGKVAPSRRLRQQVIRVEQLYDGGVIQPAVTSVQTGDASSFLSGKLTVHQSRPLWVKPGSLLC